MSRYHDSDDVIGFCPDYRHPWGCQDDDTQNEPTDTAIRG